MICVDDFETELRPALRAALANALRGLDPESPMWWKLVDAATESGASEWCRAPGLARVGYDLLEHPHEDMQRWACRWLADFPSLETVARLGAVIADPRQPVRVRDQAAWSLAFRQSQTRDAIVIPRIVEDAADAVLLAAWSSGAWAELPLLISGARHSRDERLFALLATDAIPLAIATGALEAFATPELARRLLGSLAAICDEDRVRMIRLVGAVLGLEAVVPLLALADHGSIGDRVEALFTVLAIDPDAANEPVTRFLGSLTIGAMFEARAVWHREHPGAHPIVGALRIARITATIDRAARAAECAKAAAGFAALGVIAPFGEQYLIDLWRHVAARSGDPTQTVSCVEALPSPFDEARFLGVPYLEALAASGRFRRLAQVAVEIDAAAHATWILASHHRPVLALGARRRVRQQTELSLAGQALALAELGREDLAKRALDEDLPASAPLWAIDGAPPFPGPDEIWRQSSGDPHEDILRAVIARNLDALRALQVPPGEDADSDSGDRAPLAAVAAALARDLKGASVVMLGKFFDEPDVRAWLEHEGAVIASAPFARAQFVVTGHRSDPQELATLLGRGAVRLSVPRSIRSEEIS